MAEQCHNQKFYLRCFTSDFDDVKSKFDLLIKKIEKTASNEYEIKNEDDLKNEDNLKNEDDLKNEDNLKHEDNLEQMTRANIYMYIGLGQGTCKKTRLYLA